MSVRCFVDASLLLRARAAEWLDRLWQQRSGRTRVQVLSEFYVTATRELAIAEDLAWDEVQRYFAWAPQKTNESLMRRARDIQRRHGLGWWDSCVVAAAQMQDLPAPAHRGPAARKRVRRPIGAQPVYRRHAGAARRLFHSRAASAARPP